MVYNMSFTDIIYRYALIMLLGILAGATQSLVFVVLILPVFISAITGMCPVYQILGINHCKNIEH